MIICDVETEGLEATHDVNCKVRLIGMLDTEAKACTFTSLEKFPKYLELWDDREWCFHNAKFDLQVLLNHGVSLNLAALQLHDTQVMAYCWDTSLDSYSLDNLSKLYLGHRKVQVDDWKEASMELLVQRCKKDLELTAALFEYLHINMLSDQEAYAQYLNVEVPYVKILVLMEQAGACVDVPALTSYGKVLERYLRVLDTAKNKLFYSFKSGTVKYARSKEQEWLPLSKQFATTYYSNVKGEKKYQRTELDVWNTNSPEQNARVLSTLYPRYDFQFRETKTGKLTVNSKELTSYDVPLSQIIKKYVDAEQKLSSFVRPILGFNEDGVVFGKFNQTVTRTGRLSSSEPNLQNIPRKGKHGAKFRSFFVAPEGKVLLCGDLDRIEIVILAHYLHILGFSDYMAEAIRAGVDVHSVNTEKWFSISKDDKDFGKYRDFAKTVIFAIIYGAGAAKIAANLKVSKTEAKAIMTKVDAELNLQAYKDSVALSCRQNGGVLHTVMGRRLVVPEILSSNQDEYQSGYRKINNYLIQGSAGDIFKELQLRAFDKQSMFPNIVVHDEAVYEVTDKRRYPTHVAKKLSQIYSADDILSVPITCTFSVGKTWKEAK